MSGEEEDEATRRTGVCADIVEVKAFVRWGENVASREEKDFLATAAVGEVEATSALSVKHSLGSNGGPEDRNKSSTNVDGWVQIGNGFQEAWAGRPGIDGAPEFHFDVGHAELLEKTQAAVRRGAGVLAREYLTTDVQMGPSLSSSWQTLGSNS